MEAASCRAACSAARDRNTGTCETTALMLSEKVNITFYEMNYNLHKSRLSLPRNVLPK
jgi:hypothetical protein